jgi:hypothetical protein
LKEGSLAAGTSNVVIVLRNLDLIFYYQSLLFSILAGDEYYYWITLISLPVKLLLFPPIFDYSVSALFKK